MRVHSIPVLALILLLLQGCTAESFDEAGSFDKVEHAGLSLSQNDESSVAGQLTTEAGDVDTMTAIPAPATEDCETVHAWVEANAERLPTQYNDFARYSMAYRRGIYSALPAEQQIALWKEHLRRYLESHRDLSAEQVKVLKQVLATFELNDNVLDEQTRTIEEAFGQEEARLIIATLGPEEAPEDHSLAAPDCECNQIQDYCWWGWCREVGNSCRRKSTGCGSGWNKVCNGVCF